MPAVTHHVVPARIEDSRAWLAQASAVEPLFGPRVDNPGFQAALKKYIARGMAICLRSREGLPGTPLAGGLP